MYQALIYKNHNEKLVELVRWKQQNTFSKNPLLKSFLGHILIVKSESSAYNIANQHPWKTQTKQVRLLWEQYVSKS